MVFGICFYSTKYDCTNRMGDLILIIFLIIAKFIYIYSYVDHKYRLWHLQLLKQLVFSYDTYIKMGFSM
jgi:hypothetical protein